MSDINKVKNDLWEAANKMRAESNLNTGKFVVPIEKIEAQNYSLNAGRYVGTADAVAQDYVFEERLKELNDELLKLNSESRILEEKITHNINQILITK